MTTMAKRSLLRRILIAVPAVLLLIAGILVAAVLLTNKPRPDGEAGPAADALARSIEATIHKEAWERTGAVTWFFGGRQRHLWDRQRMLDRVTWGDNEVLVNLTTQSGLAFKKGVAQSGAANDKLVKKA